MSVNSDMTIKQLVTLHVSVWVEIYHLISKHILKKVTLHVSVWVEIVCLAQTQDNIQVTLHVSVWVEITVSLTPSDILQVTLHVSVWVEIQFLLIFQVCLIVTLHVSVWVEISLFYPFSQSGEVTLHVSVWVEILRVYWKLMTMSSRSTWACELKCQRFVLTTWKNWSRSTWACELKCIKFIHHTNTPRHAPRERVSWNISSVPWLLPPPVTLHVSVWVEIPSVVSASSVDSSRSTWACELKLKVNFV